MASEPSETDKRMVSLIQDLYRIYLSKETGYEFRIRAVFYEILYLMVSTYRETEVEESELKNSRRLDALSKITTYMREHYREDLKLSGLAAMFGYSDAYLSRMFRKYAKVNFKTYLHNGDPLGKPTIHVPKGIYFEKFTDAAVDREKRQSSGTLRRITVFTIR